MKKLIKYIPHALLVTIVTILLGEELAIVPGLADGIVSIIEGL